MTTAAALLLGRASLTTGAEEPPDRTLPGAHVERTELDAETAKDNGRVFETAWRIIDETYFDPTFHGLDWNGVRTELLPRARAAGNVHQLRRVIEEMLARLGDSHMALIPGDAAPLLEAAGEQETGESLGGAEKGGKPTPGAESRPAGASPSSSERSPAFGEGQVGMDVRLLEGQMVVTRVDAAGPAALEGVKPGWILVKIGSRLVADILKRLPDKAGPARPQFLAWRATAAALSGAIGSKVQLELLDGAMKSVSLTVERAQEPGEPAKLGYLPEFYARFEGKPLELPGGGRVGLIRFNVWMIPIVRALDEKIDAFRNAEGIVLDLRGNLGGLGGMILGVSGHFLNERVSLGTLKMRGNELSFFANPRRVNVAGQPVTPFAGPLAILTDALSLSAAEIFAGGMQGLGRARVFGQTTGGQALPAIWDRLPNGDLLYHAFGDFVTANNARLEGRGVVPDEVTPLRREDLLAGRDVALEAALRWIAGQRRAN